MHIGEALEVFAGAPIGQGIDGKMHHHRAGTVAIGAHALGDGLRRGTIRQ